MKRFILILFFISICVNSYSQDYDLIVNIDGDSIACNIDSITDTHIYFEMKFKKIWIHTNYNKNSVIDYKYEFLDKNTVDFKTGTSIIRPEPYLLKYKKNSKHKNSFIISLNIPIGTFINYERRFYPEKGKISYGIQLSYSRDKAYHDGVHESIQYYYRATAGFFTGKDSHNHFEANFGVAMHYTEIYSYNPVIETGYRANFNDWIFIRTGISWLEETGLILPGLYGGFGISF